MVSFLSLPRKINEGLEVEQQKEVISMSRVRPNVENPILISA